MAYLIGAGTTIARLTTAPSTYTTVAQVKDITPPAMEMGTVEVTNLVSTAREHRSTIADPGEASFTIQWDPDNATHADLWTIFQDKTVATWRVTVVDAVDDDTVIQFDGMVTSFPVDQLTVDAVAELPVTIQVSGMPTITTGS